MDCVGGKGKVEVLGGEEGKETVVGQEAKIKQIHELIDTNKLGLLCY